mmetsp:Transcript_30136/g.69568  ORF Transcript_30136/g.69568 Transcript_30136/m.69568 type:complete len:472 (+) Transcript_30136:37-1452(+)
MGRRRFAKKGEEVRHFKLVARPGADDDDDKPPLVLEPFAPPGSLKRTGRTEAELLTVPESLRLHVGSSIYQLGHDEEDRELKRKQVAHGGLGEDVDHEDLDGDCYFPPDGYDYEQHLKSVSGTKKAKSVVGVVIDAPEPVKEEDFMKQPPTNDDEQEVLRALEHVDEYEELEDDVMAEVVEAGLVEHDTVLWGPTAMEHSYLPDMAVFAEHKALLQARARGGEEDDNDFEDGLDELDGGFKSNGAKGSMARPVKEEDFERFMADQYGHDEIGARDEDDIEGQVELDDALLDEYLEEKECEQQELVSLYEPQRGFKDDEPRVIAETRAIIERHYMEEESEEETESGDDSDDESRTWDCETVLSTLSNLSNRPGKIGKIKMVKAPVEKLKPVAETEGTDDDAADVVELPDVVTTREKGETAEEKKARKASVKEMRRICRQMKKDSKEMYKKEAARLPGQGGADLRQKTRTVKY